MKFLHSMIRVKDLDSAVRFYKDFLGLVPSKTLRLNDCTLYYFKDEETGVEIELTHNDEVPESDYIVGNAFGHFAFEVDMDAAIKRVEEMQYSWVYEPYFMKEVNKRVAFLKDPDGNSIELIEA